MKYRSRMAVTISVTIRDQVVTLINKVFKRKKDYKQEALKTAIAATRVVHGSDRTGSDPKR